MSRRDQIRMSESEVREFLAAEKYVQVATLNPDGSPHLVPLWYLFHEGRVGFWTYGTSRKIKNLERDQRITALVENHSLDYEDLRGVQMRGTADIVRDREAIVEFGARFLGRFTDVEEPDARRSAAAEIAEKRVVVYVNPDEIVSWDHAKLNEGY